MFYTDNIAILMATYNGQSFIREQIESILSQTYQYWDLYIHDDGSKDETVSIIQQYVDKYPKRIHIVEGDGTGGAKNNFFYLMRNIDAPYIMFCDQDDVWNNDKIAKTWDKMEETEKKN